MNNGLIEVRLVVPYFLKRKYETRKQMKNNTTIFILQKWLIRCVCGKVIGEQDFVSPNLSCL